MTLARAGNGEARTAAGTVGDGRFGRFGRRAEGRGDGDGGGVESLGSAKGGVMMVAGLVVGDWEMEKVEGEGEQEGDCAAERELSEREGMRIVFAREMAMVVGRAMVWIWISGSEVTSTSLACRLCDVWHVTSSSCFAVPEDRGSIDVSATSASFKVSFGGIIGE